MTKTPPIASQLPQNKFSSLYNSLQCPKFGSCSYLWQISPATPASVHSIPATLVSSPCCEHARHIPAWGLVIYSVLWLQCSPLLPYNSWLLSSFKFLLKYYTLTKILQTQHNLLFIFLLSSPCPLLNVCSAKEELSFLLTAVSPAPCTVSET